MARVRDFLTFYFRNNFRQKNCKNGMKNPYMLVTRFPLVLTVYRWVRYLLSMCICFPEFFARKYQTRWPFTPKWARYVF